MKALLFLVLVVVLVGGGWFYLQANNDPITPDTAFDKLGIPDSDPTMEMQPLDGTTEGSDIDAGNVPPAPDTQNQQGSSAASSVKSFDVTAANFAYSTKEIRVKKGDKVTINFESTGGLHDWVVDEFEGARTEQVRPGTKTSATFTADKAGTFEFYCSVGDHRSMGMVGKLIVE